MELINRYRITTALFLGVLGYAPLWAQNIDFTPDKPDGPAKIQSSLWELAIPGAAKPTRDLQDTVVVILVPHLGQASASIDTSSLAALGGRVLAQSKSLMRVSVLASSLLAVSELPGVRFVRRPHRPRSQVTISEGASRIGALANHSAGVKGQRVKVGIIDSGFKGADELPGDMPGFWWVDFTGEGIYAGEDVHGTACAEIIHDVAPEAELYLYKIRDLLDFENAKDRAIRDDIDVISHSVSFLDGFGDGRGFSCDIVNDAADNGILWVNSAGNYAKAHYSGVWSDTDRDPDGWHNFAGEDELLSFEAEEGDEISISLTWDDWPITYQNYDLSLYFEDSSGDLREVDESTDIQGSSGGFPEEWIEYEAQESGTYGIAVYSTGAQPRRLKIWSSHDFKEYSVEGNSIGIPADARGSISVGAVYHRNWHTGQIEDYSSRGPTTDNRTKPDLVAPTGVSTASNGPEGFFGTSAAAPHAAAAAALIKSANPSYSRTQLRNALVAATVDIGTRGRDNDSGYGKLVLPVMKVSANTTPRISSVSPQTVQTNTVVTVSGSNFGSSRGSSSVRIGSVVIPSSAFTSWSSSRIRFRIPLNTPPGNLTVRTSQGTSNSVRLQITSPYLTGISPTRAQTGDRLTLTGGNFGNRRGSGYVLFASNVRPSAADYVSWSNSRIVVKVSARARSGNVQVTTSNGTSGTKRLVIESASPRITSVSPRRVQYNQTVTVTGSNFGSSRGSSTVRIGSIAIPSSALTSWSNTRIRFRVPTNVRSGSVTVRTSAGTSNAIRLEITSPYLASVSPSRVKPGDRLTLTGANFRSSRGSSYVLFAPNVWSTASSDYVVWSDSRIVVKVPAGAQSGDVRVVTVGGSSGTKRIVVESVSPRISSVSPSQVQYDQVVTVTGSNFGSSRGSSTVRIGSIAIPSASLAGWSNTRIRFRVPTNMRSGNVTVRTSAGTSNAIRLEITNPYLGNVSPVSVRPGGLLTLTGANFRSTRWSGYVLFTPNVRPASSDYVSWSDSRIVVRVPAGAQSGDVKVVAIGALSSGTKRIVVESASPPRITSVSPRQVQYNQVVTVTGSNFGSSRGSSTVRIGSVVIPSSSLASWSNTRIRFRVPTNVRSGNVTVRTSAGTSNAVRLGIISPYLASVSPSRVKPGDRLTLTGANFRSSRRSGYVLFAPNVRPSSGDYVVWSDSRIVVRVPAGAQSGDVKVVTGDGTSGTKRIVVESVGPRITSVSPRQVQYNQVVTVTGSNFGSSRGSSSVRIGSIRVSSFTGWSNTIIRFRVPTNVRSGNVTVRTSAGTSNAIRLEITSPYLSSVSPSRVKPGNRLTLTGANFRSTRGSGYVLFTPNVRPASSDYVSWSNSRIVVRVPVGAQSGEVKVVATGSQVSGIKHIVVEGEVVESLPSRGLFGYSPPAVTKNPKSVKFGFRTTNSNLACYFSIKEISDGEVTIFLNKLSYGSLNSIPTSEDWTHWYLVLDRADLRSGTNIIEFRNIINQNRTSSFARWQLKDVWVDEPPPSAKLVAGMQLLSKLSDGLVSSLGDPFPTPFNAEVTIPFALADAGPVRLVIYNLMGQPIRVLADSWLAAGAHRVSWNGRTAAGVEAASGVYWAVLQTGGAVQTAKLALIR